MFTGIIEVVGEVLDLLPNQGNLDIWVGCTLASELKIDQSIAHNGACLTVVELGRDRYRVTAVKETLDKTGLGFLKVGDPVNLERSMLMNGRIDGHIVQGHVDQTAICQKIESHEGSKIFTFSFDSSAGHINVNKGSVCVNGVSLTVVDPSDDVFSVAVIPYTLAHTNFKDLKTGDVVNLEFDIIGKYVAAWLGKGANS
jgi:riboflavin synthase